MKPKDLENSLSIIKRQIEADLANRQRGNRRIDDPTFTVEPLSSQPILGNLNLLLDQALIVRNARHIKISLKTLRELPIEAIRLGHDPKYTALQNQSLLNRFNLGSDPNILVKNLLEQGVRVGKILANK